MSSVSIIINTTGLPDRLNHLSNLLLSLSRQSIKDSELIVASERVDKELVKVFERHFCSCNRHRLIAPGFWNKCKTANVAIRASKGDIVVLLEDDLTLDDMWLEEVIETFKIDPMVGCVYSRCVWVYKEGLTSKHGLKGSIARLISCLSVHKSLFSKQYKRISKHLVEVPVFTMCVACRRDVLFEAGLFDESLEEPIQGEDYDLALRIRALGYKIITNEKAIAHHYTRQVSKKSLRILENPEFIKGIYESEIYFLTKNLSLIGFHIRPHMIYRLFESLMWTPRSRNILVPMYGIKGLLKGFLIGLEKKSHI